MITFTILIPSPSSSPSPSPSPSPTSHRHHHLYPHPHHQVERLRSVRRESGLPKQCVVVCESSGSVSEFHLHRVSICAVEFRGFLYALPTQFETYCGTHVLSRHCLQSQWISSLYVTKMMMMVVVMVLLTHVFAQLDSWALRL